MGAPKSAQVLQGRIRQGNVAILSPFSLAYMNTPVGRINVAYL
jgi:hypothetical protein